MLKLKQKIGELLDHTYMLLLLLLLLFVLLLLIYEVGELEQKIEELLDHSDMTPEELADLLNEDIDSVTNGST